jgi:hypothetical protein
MDRVFEAAEIGRRMVVKTKPMVSENQMPIGKKLVKAARFPVVGDSNPDPLHIVQGVRLIRDLCRWDRG